MSYLFKIHLPSLKKEKMQKVSQREAKPLLHNSFPLPLNKGKGDKGGWGSVIKNENKRLLARVYFQEYNINMGFLKEAYYQEKLVKLSFSGEDIQSRVFEECEFNNCSFINCKFENSKLLNCTFIECDLSNIIFMDCRFTEVRFIKCKAIGIDWTKTQTIKIVRPLHVYII